MNKSATTQVQPPLASNKTSGDRIPEWKVRRELGAKLGYTYHTSEIKTIEEARNIYRVARTVLEELMPEPPTSSV